MESTSGPEETDLEVLVHCFSWCSCGSETHLADHIKLKTFKRPVRPGQAVALSYSIGDFDRQKHLFGHVDGLESQFVSLEFGGEWEIGRLVSALVALSEKHGAIWLDQLSIPQDPASITLHLQHMPAADGYRLPLGHAEMTLPELIDDGIEQYQRHEGRCFKTKLPRGLFDGGISSMGPKPSLHLRTENIRCLKDAYGSLSTASFPNIVRPMLRWVTPLRLRDKPPRPSRLTLSETYAEAFGSVSTAEVCDFMRRLPKKLIANSSVRAYKLWANDIHQGGIPASMDSWPSPAHEQAIFEGSLQPNRSWRSSWPEIDHERACYGFMCDYVCIHPDVAREKGLGLVVKTSDPPCIGV
jgi:hypothetical protein